MDPTKLDVNIDRAQHTESNEGSDILTQKDDNVCEKIEGIVSNARSLNHNTTYINIITVDVLSKLKETLSNSSIISGEDIEKLGEYLKQKAKLIRLYTPKDNIQLELDLINIYSKKCKAIDYSSSDFDKLDLNQLTEKYNILRYDSLSIICYLFEKVESLKWEEMEFFGRELLNIGVKIGLINYLIEYKKNSTI